MMSRRFQLLIDHDEFFQIEMAASRQRISAEEWVRCTLRSALKKSSARSLKQKHKAVARAVKFNFPTGDIEQIIAEVHDGRLDC